MLDLRFVVDHIDEVQKSLARRGSQYNGALEQLATLKATRSQTIVARDAKIVAQKSQNDSMAKAPKNTPEFQAMRDALKTIAGEVKVLEADVARLEEKISEILFTLPNLPEAEVPDGHSEADNPVVRVVGDKPSFGFAPKDHVDLATALGILDMTAAGRISGARFGLLKAQGARLERAIATFMLDLHTREHGYTEVSPPVLVKGDALRGTGQLPKFEADLFKTEKSEEGVATTLYLSPTSEVQLTNLHADEILDESRLPLRYTAHTSCFRSEAGSYGKDTRGLIRVHQFQKVELVQITTPEQSQAALEELTSHAENVLKALGLHYRVILLCTGDMGFASRRTYDLEVWLPSQNQYREISSCSNCGDFQARRAQIRCRKEREKPRLAHTLNGSGLAVGRTLVAILDQYQQADGSVVIPKVLQPYMQSEVIRN